MNIGQNGFRFGRSCISELLLLHYDRIVDILESGFNIDNIYLDFAKAIMDHGIVLKKLSLLGIRGRLLEWMKSFLSSMVSYHNPLLLLQGYPGVSQGSVIGPLLFLILIGDIDQDIAHACLTSFADDTRVMR